MAKKTTSFTIRIDDELQAQIDYIRALDINMSALFRKLIADKVAEIKVNGVK